MTLLLAITKVEAQLPAYVPTLNLEGFYSFSGTILDNSGNDHNNADYNTISTTDRFDTMMRALYFSGTGNEYLHYGDVNEFEPYTGSFSFWIYPEELGDNSSELIKPIISKWGPPGEVINSSYMIYMDGTNLCFVISDAAITDTLTTPLSNILVNQWNHVVITVRYGFINFYINSILVSETSSPISSFNITDSEFKVGGWYQDVNPNFSSFRGKIDDLGIWSRELEACEVEALYNGIDCATSGIPTLNKPERTLLKITDFLGRETDYKPNTLLIYMFSDGSMEKVCIIE